MSQDTEDDNEGVYHFRYRQLVQMLKDAAPMSAEKWGLWSEIESIKNKFGGYPPPWNE